MPATNRLGLPVVCLVGAAVVGISFLFGREAVLSADTDKSVMKWEYNVASAVPAALPARLGELGAAGWEVFSVERASQIFEQDAEKKSHLVVEKYQIISRRSAQRQ